jgi:hypothetical protein
LNNKAHYLRNFEKKKNENLIVELKGSGKRRTGRVGSGGGEGLARSASISTSRRARNWTTEIVEEVTESDVGDKRESVTEDSAKKNIYDKYKAQYLKTE